MTIIARPEVEVEQEKMMTSSRNDEHIGRAPCTVLPTPDDGVNLGHGDAVRHHLQASRSCRCPASHIHADQAASTRPRCTTIGRPPADGGTRPSGTYAPGSSRRFGPAPAPWRTLQAHRHPSLPCGRWPRAPTQAARRVAELLRVANSTPVCPSTPVGHAAHRRGDRLMSLTLSPCRRSPRGDPMSR
jgi:hypothetical protein